MEKKKRNKVNYRSSVTKALAEIKPKRFFGKIISRFTRKDEPKLDEQTIVNLENDAEKKVKMMLSEEHGCGNTGDYVRQYIKEKSAQEHKQQIEQEQMKGTGEGFHIVR